MRTIPLVNDRGVLVVDDCDYPMMSGFRWRAKPDKHRLYACKGQHRDGDWDTAHRLVLAAPAGFVVDHLNGDGLDCRRENLRLATLSENAQNRAAGGNRTSTSRYLGVSWRTAKHRWIAQICVQGRGLYLGLYDSEEAAARAYDRAAREHFGSLAHVNFP